MGGWAALSQAAPPTADVPQTTTAPAVTAEIDDPAWDAAVELSRLTLSLGENGEGMEPSGTTVRVMWDAGNLYVRFLCEGSRPYLPRKGRDAELYRGDACEVFLDPVGDGRAVIEIQVSPAGDVFDQVILLTTDAKSDAQGVLNHEVLERDYWPVVSWNMEKLRAAAKPWTRNGKMVGWIIDLAIPADSVLRRVGLNRFKPMDMRANFLRYDWLAPTADSPDSDRKLRACNWAPVKYGCPHISPAAMGTLRLK